LWVRAAKLGQKQHCVVKFRQAKRPEFSAEEMVIVLESYCPKVLQSAMLRHAAVPDDFEHDVIIRLLNDKRGDFECCCIIPLSSESTLVSNMYRLQTPSHRQEEVAVV